MSKTAVCYVTDTGFLLPTLVSIRSLCKYPVARDVAIYVFLTPDCSDIPLSLRDELKASNVEIVRLDRHMLDEFNNSDFNKTHVPLATLGRFFIEALLPTRVERIVYVDGDTMLLGDPRDLFAARIPEGRLGAIEDFSFILRDEESELSAGIRSYMRGIGLAEASGYFNAGVLVGDRQAFREIMADALAFFRLNAIRCRYHDQSALNAVAGDRRVRLPFRWNFQTHYRIWGATKRFDPRLLHFTTAAKPWLGRCPPWGSFCDHYRGDRFSADVTALVKQPAQAGERAALHLRNFRRAILYRTTQRSLIRSRLERMAALEASIVAAP